MQLPKPFAVYQSVPGQSAKPLFVIHAYTVEAARAQVAAMIAGETIVLPAASAGARR